LCKAIGKHEYLNELLMRGGNTRFILNLRQVRSGVSERRSSRCSRAPIIPTKDGFVRELVIDVNPVLGRQGRVELAIPYVKLHEV
jgi:hypothetical protein